MEKKNETRDVFEEQLRHLNPQPAPADLKARLDQSLGHRGKRPMLKIGLITAVAAAVVVLAAAWWIAGDPAPPQKPIADQRSVGHQQILVEASEPVFRDIPGTGPMWQIDLKLLNRFFVETPEGLDSSEFLVENRTVFVPVVYQ